MAGAKKDFREIRYGKLTVLVFPRLSVMVMFCILLSTLINLADCDRKESP